MGSHSVLGYWTYSRELHINRLQLEAAFRALRSFAHFLRGKVVLLYTDNMMVACSANKGDGGGGGWSTPLCVWTEEMLLWHRNQGISLSARLILGKLNIVANAFSLSQSFLHT